MFAGEGESGFVVIECSGLPCIDGVTGLAGGGEAGAHMVGAGGLLKGDQVAADAGGRCAGELAADVARGALYRGVFASEREPGSVVIKVGGLPASDRVAALATGREASRGVVGVGCFLERRQVATDAR